MRVNLLFSIAAALWFACMGNAGILDGVLDKLLDEIVDALTNAVDCASCQALLVPVQLLAHLGDGAFGTVFTEVCKTLNVEDDDVCTGLFTGDESTGRVVSHSLRGFLPGGNTAIKFCSSVLGLCQQPAVTRFNVPFPKSAPANPKNFVSQGKTPFQVVHFSDVHIDRDYTVDSDANCTKPICCRNFADHTGPVGIPAGPFGNRKCDSPIILGDSMLDAIGQFGSSAKFSIFTGDVVEHDIWLVNKEETIEALTGWNSQMASKLHAPVYPSLGNHDAAPVNSFPRDDTDTPLNAQFVFDLDGQQWQQWINATAAQQISHSSGSYSVVVPGTSLRLISMNTQYWYQANIWLFDTNKMPADPNGVLSFVVSQLQLAEDAGQRAWLFGHVPPGKNDFFHDQSNYFDQIVQRYQHVISGQFYGHTHRDELEIAYSDYDNQNAATANSFGLICPSLTPTSGHPSFKLYDIDPDTYEVMDAKVYIANISSPTFQDDPTWELYYSARDLFGPMVGNLGPTDSLNATFWHKLTEVFEKDDSAFQLYVSHMSRGADSTSCTGDCKTNMICDIRAMRSQNNCDKVTPGLSFKRSEPGQPLQRDDSLDCEGAGAHTVLRRIVSQVGGAGLDEEAKAKIRRALQQANLLKA